MLKRVLTVPRRCRKSLSIRSIIDAGYKLVVTPASNLFTVIGKCGQIIINTAFRATSTLARSSFRVRMPFRLIHV